LSHAASHYNLGNVQGLHEKVHLYLPIKEAVLLTNQSRSTPFGASLRKVLLQIFNKFVKYMEECIISLRKLGMRRISVWLKIENYCQLLVEVFQH